MMNSENISYKGRLRKAEKEIRKWQDKNTGMSNTELTKAQSKSVLINLCPYCEFDGACQISTHVNGKRFKLCQIKSWELQNIWVRVTDERSKVEMGHKYGNLTVRNRRYFIAKKFLDPQIWFVCQCDCGNFVTVRGYHLTTGHTVSCGCGCIKPGPKKDTVLRRIIISDKKKKKFRYNKGSSTNPDKSRHVFRNGRSGKVGCKTDHLIEIEDERYPGDTIKAFEDDRCDECLNLIRENDHGYGQCESPYCGLIH